MNVQQIVRKQLLSLLKGGRAHMGFDDAVSGFPLKEINRKVPNGSYTVWHLLEHMRIAQRDIIEFVRDPDYVSPDFPGGYWPTPDQKATTSQWKNTVAAIRADMGDAEKLVADPKNDLFAPIPHAKDVTIFQEVLLLADHNVFHIAELVTLRRVLNMKPVKEY